MDEWPKQLSTRRAADPWGDDFPLGDLPDEVTVDATGLTEAHPMFLLRLATFLRWHRHRGRRVTLIGPHEEEARQQFAGLRVADVLGGIEHDLREREVAGLGVVPMQALTSMADVEQLADAARQLIEYELLDVSRLGSAVHMAVSELCNNALEHGQGALPPLVVAQRFTEPRRRISIAVADLGIGIPEHLRRQHPEWHDDSFAIGQAFEYGISGTGHPHRGNGLPETLSAALTSTLHAARLDVHAANGFLRTEVVQERVKRTPFPAPRYKRGTWISYDLVSV